MRGALDEAVDDCDEFLVAVPVTPGELDEVCGSSNDRHRALRAHPDLVRDGNGVAVEERLDRPN